MNEDILYSTRFRVYDMSGIVNGTNLLAGEKKEIMDKIEDDILAYKYPTYKFIYTDMETLNGNVTIYIGDNKKEGTFEVTRDGKDYSLYVEGRYIKYTISRAVMNTKTSVMEPVAFMLDVTKEYKTKYPSLEQAYVQQIIRAVR